MPKPQRSSLNTPFFMRSVLYGKEAQTISEEESSSITETLLLGKMNANLNELSKVYNKADSSNT